MIAGENLAEEVPLYKDSESNLFLPSTQFDMHSSENSGLVKFDILGLNTLTVINKTIEMLKNKGVDDMTEEELNEQIKKIETDYAHILNPVKREEKSNGKRKK